MQSVLKKLVTRSPQSELESAAQAEAAGRQALAQAELVLAVNESTYGDRLVDAGEDYGKVREIEGERTEAQRAVERLRAAHAALVTRHELAKAAVDQQALDDRFAETEKRLKVFRKSAEKMIELAKALGAAQREAEDAAVAAYQAMPLRRVLLPDSTGFDILPSFNDLSGQVSMLVATAALPPGVTRSILWEYAQQPTLLQQIDSLTAEWMSLRNQSEPPKAA